MSDYNCDVIFYENVKYAGVSVINLPVGSEFPEWLAKEAVEVGRLSDFTIEVIDDITPEHIEILKAEKERIAVEAQVKMNNLDEQIQSLLAIEFKE